MIHEAEIYDSQPTYVGVIWTEFEDNHAKILDMQMDRVIFLAPVEKQVDNQNQKWNAVDSQLA